MGKVLALVGLAVLVSSPGWSQVPSVTVNFPAWTKTVTAADLVTPNTAGSNVTSSYTNTGGSLDLINLTKKVWYTVSATRTNYPNDGLAFSFLRTGDGDSNNKDKWIPDRPDTYHTIGAGTTLFQIWSDKNGAISGITFTIQIAQVTLTLPIGTHSTSITLSIT